MHGPTFAPTLAPPASVAPPAPRPRPARPMPKPDPASSGGANLVLTYLKLHGVLIVFAGTLLAGGLAYLAYSLVPNKYESTAILRVASVQTRFTADADPTKGETAFATYIKTQRILLKTDAVLNDALTRSDEYRIDRLPTVKAQKDPLKWLDEKLVVEAPEGQENIFIRLEGEDPEDVQKIVKAVQTSFLEQVVQRSARDRADVNRTLQLAMTKFLEDLRRKLGTVEQSRSGFGPPAPPAVVQADSRSQSVAPIAVDAAGAGPAVNPIQRMGGVMVPVPGASVIAMTDTPEHKRMVAGQLQADIHRDEDLLTSYPEKIAEAKGKLAEFEAKRRAVAAPAKPSEQALVAALGYPEVMQARAEVTLAERAAAAYASPGDPNARPVVAARQRVADAKAALDAAQLERAAKLEGPAYEQRAEQLSGLVGQATDAVRLLERGQRVTTERLDKARAKIAAINVDIKKADEAKAAVDLAKSQFGPLDKVLQSMVEKLAHEDLAALAPSRVQIHQHASVPRQKDAKKQLMAALAAAAAGFGLVGFGAIGYEFRVRKVSSLAELKAGGPNVVGVIPFLPDAAAADPVKRADVAEAIDKLRATVAQEWLGRGTATILVTSPLADEGKALTAYRLATSLAQAGTRTLLVDFDLRTPTLHQFAGVDNTHGVADILRGDADPRSGQILLPSGLAFLPAGAWLPPAADDPAGLPPTLGAALDPLLHKLRSDVDCLIVHGHSILTAADTVELARRADAVLLCALYRETRMPLVKRAADRVLGMAGPAAGAVYIGATRHEALC